MYSNNSLTGRILNGLRISLIALLFIFVQSDLFSATINLNNGKTIKGRILSSTKNTIKIRVRRRNKTVKISDVKDIKYDKKDKKVNLPKKEEKIIEKDTGEGFVDKFDLRAGGMAGVALPVGSLSSSIGLGFGGLVFADMMIPQNLAEGFFVRANVLTGFLMYTGKAGVLDGFLGSVPFIIGAEASFVLPFSSFNLRPYFGFGGGITYNFISGTSDTRDLSTTASIDGTMSVRIGTGFTLNSLKQVEFLFDINYMLALETVPGHFIAIQLGAAYRFSSSASEKKETSLLEGKLKGQEK